MISEIRARRYCSEDISLIQNYSEAIADETQTWECHHRAEILPCGRYSQAQLDKHGLFKHVPASQLIFLTKAEHNRLHKLGKPRSEETKAKISASSKGKKLSAEHCMKIAEYSKHRSSEHRAKIAEALKGKPSGMKGQHHSEEAKSKISETRKLWWQKWREEHGRV